MPPEHALGWSRASIALAIGINIFLYGLVGPFAGAAMQRFGIRRVVLVALGLIVVTVGRSCCARTRRSCHARDDPFQR